MTRASLQEVEQLLYREARLLDGRQLEEWLAMFTGDAVYWCPSNRYDIDPRREVSIIYDDAARLADRVGRLRSGLAFAQQPPSRTRRHVTNVEIVEEGELLVAHSNFIIVEVRRGKQNLFSGHNEHRLRQVRDEWKIAFKKIDLVNNDLPFENLAFLL